MSSTIVCRKVGKTKDNPFIAGESYRYSENLNLVFDSEDIPWALGTFENTGPLVAYSDYYDPKSKVVAMFEKGE